MGLDYEAITLVGTKINLEDYVDIVLEPNPEVCQCEEQQKTNYCTNCGKRIDIDGKDKNIKRITGTYMDLPLSDHFMNNSTIKVDINVNVLYYDERSTYPYIHTYDKGRTYYLVLNEFRGDNDIEAEVPLMKLVEETKGQCRLDNIKLKDINVYTFLHVW